MLQIKQWRNNMFIELHMIQNFAPSCLNRDDTNSPKDCEFGGYRRARISSQCLKRAIRRQFGDEGLVGKNDLAVRTRLLVPEIMKLLVDQGKDENAANTAVKAALQGIKIATDKDDKTEYLIFMAQNEIQAIADLCNRHWDTLSVAKDTEAEKDEKKSAKQKKKEKRAAIPSEVIGDMKRILKDGKAADLALFGRMFADNPNFNVDAAAQVAHAISTHKITMDMDFFTAVDDLQTAEESGAGMMGTIGFNSACFYRYSVVDVGQLMENLGTDKEMAKRTVDGFLRSSIMAIPTGKQTTMAAHNPPSLIMVVIRSSGQPWSLANAFAYPVRPQFAGNKDLITQSIDQMVRYHSDMLGVYGQRGIEFIGINLIGSHMDVSVGEPYTQFETVDRLVDAVKEKVHDSLASAP